MSELGTAWVGKHSNEFENKNQLKTILELTNDDTVKIKAIIYIVFTAVLYKNKKEQQIVHKNWKIINWTAYFSTCVTMPKPEMCIVPVAPLSLKYV